jgi:hypothetical protein
MENKEKDFEQLWLENKKRLLNKDKEYRDAVATYGMSSGADWLLFGIPVATGIVCVEMLPISSEVLRWVVSVAITIVVFALCVWVKSLSNPHRAIADIEKDVKKRCHEQFLKTGKLE